MPTRATFVIYQDEPSSSTQPKPTNARSRKTSTTRIEAVTARDKENLHPLTGRRPSNDDSQGKKRKTGVLATKLLVTTTKSQKGPHSPKKRKLSVSSSKGPIEKKEKKEREQTDDKKTAVNRRPAKKTRVRKTAGLPKVEEELEEGKESESVGEKVPRNIMQSQVDSRCYELTVLPLADLSKAYEQSPPPEVLSEPENAAAAENCTESTSGSERATSPAPSEKADSSTSPSQRNHSVFSTPERKRIYSVFTFESPSPASKRFAASKLSSIEPFYDLRFDSVLDRVLKASAGP